MRRRMACAALALWMALAALLGLGGKGPEPKDCCPIVFVHGLGGWGQGALMDGIMPHWGMLAGSMRKRLNRMGYETYAASVGPVSSAWDRACELYAHLSGTRVDYGQAHAQTHGHARYGETYQKALVKGWSAKRPVALLGHSFGGPTVRLFAQLCEQGSVAEKAAGQADLSPLFTGALKGRVFAVVTLAGTLNGSTAAGDDLGEETMGAALPEQMMSIARAGAVFPPVDWFYPFHLGQFGLSAMKFYLNPVQAWRAGDAFQENRDNAAHDLTVDGAKRLNEGIRCQPGIYYFSYAAQATRPDGNGNQMPERFVWSMFQSTSAAMGRKRAAFTTPGGVRIDDSWLPNDGLVNLVSAQYPLGEPHKSFDAQNIRRGVWQVMPVITNLDHVDFAGGMQRLGGAPGIAGLYRDIAALLDSLYAIPA